MKQLNRVDQQSYRNQSDYADQPKSQDQPDYSDQRNYVDQPNCVDEHTASKSAEEVESSGQGSPPKTDLDAAHQQEGAAVLADSLLGDSDEHNDSDSLPSLIESTTMAGRTVQGASLPGQQEDSHDASDKP